MPLIQIREIRSSFEKLVSKFMKAKDWREKHAGERKKTLLELRDKARKLRFDLATREAKKHSDYRNLKKDIARLLTIEKEESIKNL